MIWTKFPDVRSRVRQDKDLLADNRIPPTKNPKEEIILSPR
jgi:hypothetical protein